jgi:hypothetical protein
MPVLADQAAGAGTLITAAWPAGSGAACGREGRGMFRVWHRGP